MRFFTITAVCVVLFLALVFVVHPVSNRNIHTTVASNTTAPLRQVSIGSTTIMVEIASTEQVREQGLSNRASLLPGYGMLFVFDTPGRYGFWMKDMRIPLDMIFIDAHFQIINIASNLAPDTYPTIFYPAQPAQYVLEVPAGFSSEHSLRKGALVVLQ